MDCCDRFTLTSSGCSFCRYCGVYVAYDDDTTMPAVKQVETPATTVVLPPSARDKRSQQSSNIKSLKKGGAGEMWFCYEAGASVEVAPEEALLTTPLATAASVEPEALPAVLHARTCARGAERREGAAAPSQSQGCSGEGREREQQEGQEVRRPSREGRSGKKMPVSLGAGDAETAVSQLQGRRREDAIGHLRVGRASRQECAAGASAGRAEQGARAIR